MKILSLYTATACCSVALLDTVSNIILFKKNTTPFMHSEKLFTLLDSLWHKGLSYKNIDILTVAVGPGSFTGIRIGIAAAQGLQLVLQKPLFGITTLEVIAFKLMHMNREKKNICAVMPAYHDKLYIQRFTHSLQQASAIQCIDIKSFICNTEEVIGGSGIVIPEQYQVALNAEYLAQLANFRISRKEKLLPAEPFYISLFRDNFTITE